MRYEVIVTLDTKKRSLAVGREVGKLLEPLGASEVKVIERKTAKSRADRLANAVADINGGLSEIETLAEEMRGWHDSIPDNLKEGSKAEEVEQTAQELESAKDNIESAVQDLESVSFPGMF